MKIDKKKRKKKKKKEKEKKKIFCLYHFEKKRIMIFQMIVGLLTNLIFFLLQTIKYNQKF